MKQLFLRTCLAVFVLLTATTSFAYNEFVEEGISYDKNNDGKSVSVSSHNRWSGKLSIPSCFTRGSKTYSVTSIGTSAFIDQKGLISVEIPYSVKSIESFAFCQCENMTSVTFEENSSLTEIGNDAFSYCYCLKSIEIPSNVTKIGDRAFAQCRSLNSLEIPSSVTSIGDYAFICCSGLTSIKVDAANTVYDSRDNCNAIIETNTNRLIAGCNNTIIPSSVTSIGYGAFCGCSDLTSINIPSSVTLIGESAFEECRNLSSVKCLGQIPSTIQSKTFSYISSDCVLYVPFGTRDAYIAAGWTTDIFKGGVIELDSEPVEISISSAGMATYCSEYDLDFSDVGGLKAYIVSGFSPSTGTLVLTPVTTVPAYTGLLLKGAEGTYSVPATTTDMYYTNLLEGVTTDTEISPTNGSETNFILADGIHGVNFYTLSETGTLAAGKAYLHLPTSEISASVNARGFTLLFDDEATGLEEVMQTTRTDNTYYDLQGRRVAQPKKGIFIVNGKKVFIK